MLQEKLNVFFLQEYKRVQDFLKYYQKEYLEKQLISRIRNYILQY